MSELGEIVPLLLTFTVCVWPVPEEAWVTETVVLLFADPPAPVHASEYVAFAVGETDLVPLVDCVPLHPPLAVHEVESVELHVIVDDCPLVIDDGDAEIVTVGAGAEAAATVTLAL